MNEPVYEIYMGDTPVYRAELGESNARSAFAICAQRIRIRDGTERIAAMYRDGEEVAREEGAP